MKRLKAQQIVEFLLVAPLIIAILGILTELAYAFNLDMTLKSGVNSVAQSLYTSIKPGQTKKEIELIIETKLKNYLKNKNVPYVNSVKVETFELKDFSVILAHYTYYPAFLLPNIFFSAIPESYTFSEDAHIHKSFLRQNNLVLKNDDLKYFYSSIPENASNGVLKNNNQLLDLSYPRERIAYFVPIKDPLDASKSAWQVLKFNGKPFMENAYVKDFIKLVKLDGSFEAPVFEYLANSGISTLMVADGLVAGNMATPVSNWGPQGADYYKDDFTKFSGSLIDITGFGGSSYWGMNEKFTTYFENEVQISNVSHMRVYLRGSAPIENVAQSREGAVLGVKVERK